MAHSNMPRIPIPPTPYHICMCVCGEVATITTAQFRHTTTNYYILGVWRLPICECVCCGPSTEVSTSELPLRIVVDKKCSVETEIIRELVAFSQSNRQNGECVSSVLKKKLKNK